MVPGAANRSGAGAGPDNDLTAAPRFGTADRDREVAQSTRRVVMASLGVIKEQKAGRKRGRAIALASILVCVFVLGPLIWWAVDEFVAGEHFSDLTCEFGLWICILCAALLAAAVMAGWLRRRS